MAYIALYRKWRPQTFSDLVGQEAVEKTLSHAISSGRIGHAYLFSGPRGTGKTSTAKIFAKAVNCEQGPTPDPCGVCASCTRISDGSSMDVFEIDAASNRGIDEIRELRETVKFAPTDGRYKVYIIDEVHMLTTEAFNALLKTLEEPPAHVIFILATTEAHKVPATIQSRCQRFDFRRITTAEIEERLAYVAKETGIDVESRALALIALEADGGMRDALSLLDQCASLAEGTVRAERVETLLGLVGQTGTWKLAVAVGKKDSMGTLQIVDKLLQEGKEPGQILRELTLHYRSLMIYQAAGSTAGLDLYNVPEDVLKEHSMLFAGDVLYASIQRLQQAQNDLKWAPEPRLTLEVALLSLCRGEYALRVPDPVRSGGQDVQQANTPSLGAADTARLAKLEAKISELSAQLAAGVKRGGEQTQTARPVKAAPRVPKPDAGAVVDKREVSRAEGAAVWKSLLRALHEKGKLSVASCLVQGGAVLQKMTAAQFVISFSNAFMKSRAEKDDYRHLIEGTIQELTGESLQLVCKETTPEDTYEGADMQEAPHPVEAYQREKKAYPKARIVDDAELAGLPAESREALEKAARQMGGVIAAIPEEETARHRGKIVDANGNLKTARLVSEEEAPIDVDAMMAEIAPPGEPMEAVSSGDMGSEEAVIEEEYPVLYREVDENMPFLASEMK